MIIYEKDNKLNINFENIVEGEPDLQISKESGKTEVLIDGQPGGSGSSNFVFDLANAKRPEIDGVEYDYVYVKGSGANDEALSNVFVYDFPNGYPPILKENGLLGTDFAHVSDVEHRPLIASQGQDDGNLKPYLLENSESVLMNTSDGSYTFFPATAKFGLRKYQGK